MVLKILSNNRKCNREDWQWLVIPGCLPHRQFVAPSMCLSQLGNRRKQSQQDRCGAGNRQVRPLALWFHSRMSAHFMESYFHSPTYHEPLHDLLWPDWRIRTKQGLWFEVTFGIPDECLYQPGKQQLTHFQIRPRSSVQHSVVVLEMLFAIQTHSPCCKGVRITGAAPTKKSLIGSILDIPEKRTKTQTKILMPTYLKNVNSKA